MSKPAETGFSGWDEIACPVCGDERFDDLFELAGEPFVRCRNCELTLINPRRPFDQIRAGYNAAYSQGYQRKAPKKLKRSRRRVARLKRDYQLSGRWLDVGSGSGVWRSLVSRMSTAGCSSSPRWPSLSTSARCDDGRERRDPYPYGDGDRCDLQCHSWGRRSHMKWK